MPDSRLQAFPFATLNEVVAGLSTVPPPVGWPVPLMSGLDAATNEMRNSRQQDTEG